MFFLSRRALEPDLAQAPARHATVRRLQQAVCILGTRGRAVVAPATRRRCGAIARRCKRDRAFSRCAVFQESSRVPDSAWWVPDSACCELIGPSASRRAPMLVMVGL